MSYLYNIALFFHETAQHNREGTAVKYPGGRTLTYSELDAWSNKISNYLIDKGIEKGEVVAIFNNKSPRALATMIACLKAGLVYCNLDLSSPIERLLKIAGKCRPSIIINDSQEEKVKKLSDQLEVPFINIESAEFDAVIENGSDHFPDRAKTISGDYPAYIMFTSGSTGFPKGAVMSHQNVVNLASWAKETFSITGEDVFTNVNPIYFDNSVFDFYSSLLNGATLVPFTQDEVNQPAELVKKIDQAGCTTWFSVPSLLVYLLTTKALHKDNMKSIKRYIFGGEGFPKPQLKKLFELYHGRAELINVYGPTECTCICSSYLIGEKDFEDMKSLAPLGYIAPNFDYEILPVKENNPDFGELCLKGPNVGLGYYNDEERTNKSFIPNPNNKAFNETVYKTGDLVEKDIKGQLHFKGRVDNQIKHMGYRIELEEIEAALNMLDYVNEAGVLYCDLGNGMGQIKGFVNVRKQVEAKEVEEDLKKLIPPYMMPKMIKILDTLPKNRNGKIDRGKLAEI